MEPRTIGPSRRHSIALGLRRLSLIGSDHVGDTSTNSRRGSRDSSDCGVTKIDKSLVQRALVEHFGESKLKVRR